MSVSRKGAVAPIVIGVIGTAILLFLGAWQVQRLEWKEGLIAQIETRLAADPVALPDPLDPVRDHLLRVRVEGRLGTDELHAIHTVKFKGPGYRLIVPMDLQDQRILVDLGFVPEGQKDAVPREGSIRWDSGRSADTVTGLLYWPGEADSFTPDPDLSRNIWFARDPEQMGAALNTYPVLLVAEAHSDDAVVLPQPPGVNLPNRHLEYALTWFGLALVWAIMSIFWLRAEIRKRTH